MSCVVAGIYGVDGRVYVYVNGYGYGMGFSVVSMS